MSIKNKLLEDLDKKVEKLRTRKRSIKDQSVEAAVFRFFRDAEEARSLYSNERYDDDMLKLAHLALIQKLKKFDLGVKASIEFNRDKDEHSMRDMIRGVTIAWSNTYAKVNNCNKELYIDVSEMLFY